MQNKAGMKTFVTDLLEKNLPSFYYFHNCDHTLYVLDKAIEIGTAENCSEAEKELLFAAALWHDTGYLKTYTGHEEESCVLASQYLPEYGYSISDVDKICGIIMATKIPQAPHNKLEEIVADADLEYLGTPDAGKIAEYLFRELNYRIPELTKNEWDHIQTRFLQRHRYFTRFCKENREQAKQAYLHQLLADI